MNDRREGGVLHEILQALRELIHLLRRRLPARGAHVSIAVGPENVTMTTFTLNPGQTKTLTAAFSDSNGVNHPLGSLPTATCSDADITLTPVGTPTINDPQFQWTIAASAAAAVADVEIDVHAEGDAQAGVDPIDGKILGAIVALEDTQVALSVE